MRSWATDINWLFDNRAGISRTTARLIGDARRASYSFAFPTVAASLREVVRGIGSLAWLRGGTKGGPGSR